MKILVIKEFNGVEAVAAEFTNSEDAYAYIRAQVRAALRVGWSRDTESGWGGLEHPRHGHQDWRRCEPWFWHEE